MNKQEQNKLNLVPISSRPREEQTAIGRRGGLASAAAKKEHKRPAALSYNCAQCVYDFLAVIAREYYSDLEELEKEEKHKVALEEKKASRIPKTKQDGYKN